MSQDNFNQQPLSIHIQRDEINTNIIETETVINNIYNYNYIYNDDNRNNYDEIMLFIEGHSLLIPLPTQMPLTRIITNAHIPDQDELDQTVVQTENQNQTQNQTTIKIMCKACSKNPIIENNPYCVENYCSACNLGFYSTQQHK